MILKGSYRGKLTPNKMLVPVRLIEKLSIPVVLPVLSLAIKKTTTTQKKNK